MSNTTLHWLLLYRCYTSSIFIYLTMTFSLFHLFFIRSLFLHIFVLWFNSHFCLKFHLLLLCQSVIFVFNYFNLLFIPDLSSSFFHNTHTLGIPFPFYSTCFCFLWHTHILPSYNKWAKGTNIQSGHFCFFKQTFIPHKTPHFTHYLSQNLHILTISLSVFPICEPVWFRD